MVVREPVHLEARKGDVAEVAVVSGDPGRVRRLSSLLEDARLVSEKRGFPVYTGWRRGARITIAAHGIGGPSALIVVEELVSLGARVVVRLGTGGSLHPDVSIGDVVVASGAGYACLASGLSLYTGLKPLCTPASPDPLLTAEIYRGLSRRLKRRVHLAPVFTSDSFYAESPGLAEELASLGFRAVEMEVAPLYSLSWLRGFRASAALIVSDSLVGGFKRISDGELEEAELEVGEALLDLLAEGLKA
jgi:5'-methylthioadenosine phosphorylase